MGVVYLAHDTALRRPVALKLMTPTAREDTEWRDRLEQEALAASALNHPNILTVYDIGDIDGQHFMATEYVNGVTLRQRMMRAEPSLAEILHISTQIASALAAAEAGGLVHRDIKPDNIMLRGDGYVKLLDFGLARAIVSADAGLKQTDPYVVRGTVFYMSPEQLRGMNIDARTDIWSTGVVMYELISGRLPFEGDSTSDVVASILKSLPALLTTQRGGAVPPRLSDIVGRAMHKDRALRYQSAQEMLDDLQDLRLDLDRDVMISLGGGTGTGLRAEDALTERVSGGGPRPNNLPARLTTFVGREQEKREVVEHLRDAGTRLLTLTGPGGTGKTRLALAAGAELVNELDDGVFLVQLAPVREAELVISAIGDVLDVHEGGATLLESVKRSLRDKTLLLILDNFEQVVAAAPVVAELLNAAPNVKMLVTSRSPLHVSGEQEYAVPPLPTPPLDAPIPPHALSAYPSVALFLQRASAVKSDFAVTPENAQAIAELCTRLEGLPLAIELAAARVKLLPPQAMLSRVESRMKLLAGGSRDLPERQRTMHAAISWGFNLLDDEEKRLFTDLAVFRGGFSIGEAEAIAQATGEGQMDVLEQLSSLVNKSFLQRDASSDDIEPRFTQLETIREYGLEQLIVAGREAEVRAAHAALMASMAEQSARELAGPEHERALRRLTADHENYRAALEHALAHDDTNVALRIGGSLWWFWYLHGHYDEGRRWLEQIVRMWGADESPALPRALTGAGALAFLQCDYDRAIELLDQSIDLANRTGDRQGLARSLQFRGSIAREQGEYEHAIALHTLALATWEELGDRTSAARSQNYIAFSSWLSGDFAKTVEICRETLPLFRERNDSEGVTWSLLNLAAASFYSGDFDRAEMRLDECLSWARVAGFKEGIAWSLNLLGLVLRARGDNDRAAAILRDSLQLHWELGDRWRSASVLELLAGLIAANGSPEISARLFGATEALRNRLCTPVPPVELAQYERDVAGLRSASDPVMIDRWWDEGMSSPTGDAVALATA
jgi:non-specific serine/threonine protein kinase